MMSRIRQPPLVGLALAPTLGTYKNVFIITPKESPVIWIIIRDTTTPTNCFNMGHESYGPHLLSTKLFFLHAFPTVLIFQLANLLFLRAIPTYFYGSQVTTVLDRDN
jgi:hypothetical protein